MSGAEQLSVRALPLHLLESGQAGACRHRIPVQGADLADKVTRRLAVRVKALHQLRSSPNGCQRIAPADDLAKSGQVRHHAIILLRSAPSEAKASDHFVKNEWD